MQIGMATVPFTMASDALRGDSDRLSHWAIVSYIHLENAITAHQD